MAPTEASPSAPGNGTRPVSRAQSHAAPGDDSTVQSLRAALRDAYERFNAYLERDRELKAESDKTISEYAADTKGLLQGWITAPNVTPEHVEIQLQARNVEQQSMERQASQLSARNRAGFEGDLGAILKEIIAKDKFILETRKRAREVDSPRVAAPESPSVKRPRRTSVGGRASDSGRTSVGGNQADNGMDGRTITFDEVYQGGRAKHKHAIVTHSSAPGKWIILKCECDDHTVHFGGPKSALQGAAKHLDTMYHQMKRSYEGAVKHLGWEVLGCDAGKVTANNDVFENALHNGYIPINTRTCRKSFGSYGSAQARAAPDQGRTTRITRAKGGELYYAWWPDDEKYYLCMIIPWDNARDFGLTEIRKGIHGLGLLDRKLTSVPNCYIIDCDLDPPRITGWAEGYENGGRKENKRVFPTLFFHPPKNLAAWTKASFLRPFDWRRPNFDAPGHKLNPRSVRDALEAMAKAEGFSCLAEFEAAQQGTGSGVGETPVRNGGGGVQEEMQVDGDESVESGGGARVNENGEQVATDVPTPGGETEGASTPGGIPGETQDVPPAEAAASPTEGLTSAAPPVDQGPAAHDKSPASIPANGTASKTPASAATATTAQPAQNGVPTAPPATTPATNQTHNGVPPDKEKPLLARRSQSGTRAPTMATRTTESRPAGGSLPQAPPSANLSPRPPVKASDGRPQQPGRANTANVPPQQPAKTNTPNLPPQVSRVNTPAKAAAALKATSGAQSPAGTVPGPTPPVAKQAPDGTPKGDPHAKTSEVRPQQTVKSPPTATASLATPGTRAPAATPGQPPLASQSAQKAPAKGATPAISVQTQVGPSRAGSLRKGSPAGSPALSFASSLGPRNAPPRDPSRFYLSEYEGPDTSWHAASESDRLILDIDANKEMARTGDSQPVTLEIARKLVTSHMQFRDKPAPGKHTLTLNMKDRATETVREHRFVFDAHAGMTAKKQARAFFSWVSGW